MECADLQDDEAASSWRSIPLAASLWLGSQKRISPRDRLQSCLLINHSVWKAWQLHLQDNLATTAAKFLQKERPSFCGSECIAAVRPMDYVDADPWSEGS